MDVTVELSGDLDHLGVDHVSTSATLEFAGTYVQSASTGDDADLATAALQQFTRIDGLEPRPRGHNVLFAPTQVGGP